ncbi:hypothetical protein ABTA38_19455, partial [Acinetobacter baumannii]
ARGGLAKLRAIKSLRLTGRAVYSEGGFQQEFAVGQLIARPGKVRSETTLQGLTQVEAFDGAEGWQLNPFGGRRDAERSSADEAKGLARDAD